MHRFTLMFLVIVLSGCSKTVYRTGTVCIPPVNATKYSTSDPVEIKQDVADVIAVELHKKLPYWVDRDTKMQIVPDCEKADMKLSSSISKINPYMYGSTARNLLYGGLNSISYRSYFIAAEYVLYDNKKSTVLDRGIKKDKRKELGKTLDEVAESIANAVGKHKTSAKED